MKKQGLAGSILSYATPCKGKLIISVICALLSVAGGIIPYVAAYRIICLFFNQTATAETILYWTIVGTIGFLGKVLFHAISTTLSHISAYTILELMRKRVAEKLMKAPLGVAQGINAGRVKNIVVDQIENIEILLAHVIPEGAGALVLPIAVFSYLCMIDFRLALASLITIPLALIPYGMMLGGYNKTYQVYMEANEHMNNVVVEYMEGIEVVKAFNQSTSSYEKYTESGRELQANHLELVQINMEIYYPWCQYSADNSTGCIADWHAALSLWQHNPAKNHYGNAALYGHGQQFGPHDSVF